MRGDIEKPYLCVTSSLWGHVRSPKFSMTGRGQDSGLFLTEAHSSQCNAGSWDDVCLCSSAFLFIYYTSNCSQCFTMTNIEEENREWFPPDANYQNTMWPERPSHVGFFFRRRCRMKFCGTVMFRNITFSFLFCELRLHSEWDSFKAALLSVTMTRRALQSGVWSRRSWKTSAVFQEAWERMFDLKQNGEFLSRDKCVVKKKG